MKIGQIIQKLRIEANFTREELAEKLFVSRELVSKWENNLRQPNYAAISEIAEILDVEIDEIVSKNDLILDELSSFANFENVDEKILSEKINSFLTTLGEIDCKVFIRRYYFFEDTKEIADKLGLKDGNVRSSLFRTRKKFKKYFSED